MKVFQLLSSQNFDIDMLMFVTKINFSVLTKTFCRLLNVFRRIVVTMHILQSVLGSSDSGPQVTSAETIERLVDRVNTSTLLEDRRDACRALKAMSRKFR